MLFEVFQRCFGSDEFADTRDFGGETGYVGTLICSESKFYSEHRCMRSRLPRYNTSTVRTPQSQRMYTNFSYTAMGQNVDNLSASN